MNEKRLNGLINRVRYEEGIKACLLQQRGNSLPFYDDKQQTEKQIFLSKKNGLIEKQMVGVTGIEPVTPTMSM